MYMKFRFLCKQMHSLATFIYVCCNVFFDILMSLLINSWQRCHRIVSLLNCQHWLSKQTENGTKTIA